MPSVHAPGPMDVLQSQPSAKGAPSSREAIRQLVPGLGDTASLRIEPAHPVAGRTLKDVNLRALTGATVIAIEREHQPAIIYPGAEEILRPGDLLVVTGTEEAVHAATELVRTPDPTAPLDTGPG